MEKYRTNSGDLEIQCLYGGLYRRDAAKTLEHEFPHFSKIAAGKERHQRACWLASDWYGRIILKTWTARGETNEESHKNRKLRLRKKVLWFSKKTALFWVWST